MDVKSCPLCDEDHNFPNSDSSKSVLLHPSLNDKKIIAYLYCPTKGAFFSLRLQKNEIQAHMQDVN